MNPRDVIAWLWRYGHFHNLELFGSLEVLVADIAKLRLTSRAVIKAIQSIQSLDANADMLAWKHHSRAIEPDGIIGPATEELMQMPRCSIPDYGPESGSEAVGGGSWPVPGCDPTRPNRDNEHSLRINLDTRRIPAKVHGYIRQAERLIRECAAEMGLAVRVVYDGEPSKAEIATEFQPIPGNVIGYNYFPQPGTCRQTITGVIDTNFQPDDVYRFATLWTHENLGHGLGLNHTRGGIMNPSIITTNPLTWHGDPHESTMRRYFGGVPVPLDDDGPVDQPPIDDGPPVVDEAVVEAMVLKILNRNKDKLKGEPGPPGPPGPSGSGGMLADEKRAFAEYLAAASNVRFWGGQRRLDEARERLIRVLT